ncbi:hypothetical protein POREN0001_0497 [Porphyromonas endodontalis ATCC 35406]|uniref:Lipoprotein n=1 Tax=Porphyromonas endodontalis (strain ATCC 35406 / DSM 24491 / JCM 8526 / CCUG 16442 / BCRC 14492 / NCTC 13058 / HG 370) TaxID=553175 RepID=C3JC97_POREA|nr:hypothetical protein POREN0001_0497 [Porphyromonas endodontalis ATCC 35406]
MFIKSIEERLEGLLFLGLLFAGSCILLVSSFDILEKEDPFGNILPSEYSLI